VRDDTIFVFTADHGDMLESQWQRDDAAVGVRKQVPYDESVCVPFLLRYPARFGAAGREIGEPIATPDIMPTLLSLAGLDRPDTVQGLDLAPVLAGTGSLQRVGALFASYHPFADWRTARGGRPFRGIRTARNTFVRDRNGPWLLFDNLEDPFQLDNLVNQLATAELQANLDGELSGILDEQGDAFESPAALRERWGYSVDDKESTSYT
jgi:arylsulfatase A-like enzyme